MNKVRIIGLGLIITGFLTGYFFKESDVYMLSGMLIGLGIGWAITGRFISKPRRKEIGVRPD